MREQKHTTGFEKKCSFACEPATRDECSRCIPYLSLYQAPLSLPCELRLTADSRFWSTTRRERMIPPNLYTDDGVHRLHLTLTIQAHRSGRCDRPSPGNPF